MRRVLSYRRNVEAYVGLFTQIDTDLLLDHDPSILSSAPTISGMTVTVVTRLPQTLFFKA